MRLSIDFLPRATALRGAALALAVGLAGCASAPAYQPGAPTFDGGPVWRAPAGQIEIITSPEVGKPETRIMTRLAAAPEDVARSWPDSRLRTDTSQNGAIIFTIEKASATERFLPRKSGVTAAFTRDPESELEVAYAVSLALFNGKGEKRGSARAESRAASTLAEGSDEDDRRKLWDRLMREAAAKLDAELKRQVPAGLPGLQEEG